jgi:hypothetical protein
MAATASFLLAWLMLQKSMPFNPLKASGRPSEKEEFRK